MNNEAYPPDTFESRRVDTQIQVKNYCCNKDINVKHIHSIAIMIRL